MPAAIPQAGAPSTRQYLLTALREGCETQPSGLTKAEWHACVAGTLSITSARLGGHIQSLRATGLITTRVGRIGHQRYVPSDLPCDTGTQAPRDFVLLVLDALRVAEAKAGHPVLVGEVTKELPSDAVIRHRNSVRSALSALAAPRKRGAEELRQPVYRHTTTGTAGHLTTLWSTAPITTIPARPRSRTESIRRLVSAAQADVGIPLTATELRLWADARDGYAGWPPGWRRGLRRALTDVARHPTSCVDALHGKWALVPRFHLTDGVLPVARAAAALEEFAERADLVQETDLLGALVFRSRGRPAMRSDLARRHRLLGALIAEILGEVSLEDAVSLLKASIAVRDTLPRSVTLKKQWQKLRAQHEALFELLPSLEIAPWPGRPPVIGEAGLMTPEAVVAWIRAVEQAAEITPRAAYQAMVKSAAIAVDGEVRFDAVRAVGALLRYATSPVMQQRVTDLLHIHGTLERGGDSALGRFLETGRWEGEPLGPSARMRVRVGALFGLFES
jgi:hypothetical protein